MNPFDDLKAFFRRQGILQRLIIINAAVWLLVSFILVIGFLFTVSDDSVKGFIIDYFAVPSSFHNLVIRPWTLLTYMFLHISFFHILFNLLWLFWFGRIFLEFLSPRQLFTTYIVGGLAGAILYIFAYNIFPVFSEALPFSHALGASASIMAIVTGISFYAPGYTINMLFIGRIRILYIAIILFVLDFFMIRSDNSGGHIAHIGGAIYGYFFASYMRRGRDLGSWLNAFNFKWPSFGKSSKPSDSGPIRGNGRPLSDEEYNNRKAAYNDRMDTILDKISRSGYESLTKEEKDFLFKSGNNKK
jgi:membrane associated rhomboid family serine protease